jgi:hypothetical protein
MRYARLIALLFAFGAIPILPAPVHYTINFTGGPPTPTSGSFDYDPTTQVITNFVVVIEGASFNLTSAANSPGIVFTNVCNPGFTGAAATFGLLAGCAGSGTPGWFVSLETSPNQSLFNFEAGGAGGIAIDDYSVQATVTSSVLSGGSFTITAAPGTLCVYSVNAASATSATSGGTASVSVITSPPTNCPWTAVSNASWLTILSGASGTSAGTVNYSAAPDTGAGAPQRVGTLTIAGQTFTVSQGTPAHPLFFSGEIALSDGVYYLQAPGANFFGYYTYQFFPWLYHFDLGFEYFVDANDGAADAYFYDAASGHWWFTSASLFPYLYDFTLNVWIYYVPDPSNPGHYTTNPRKFAYTTTHQIFTM